MWKTLSASQVTLILGLATIACLVLVGVPAWAVVRGYVPPAFLFGPLGTVLVAAAAAFASYTKGQNEVPPWLADPKIQRVMQSMRPPPVDVDLSSLELPVMPPSPVPNVRPGGQ